MRTSLQVAIEDLSIVQQCGISVTSLFSASVMPSLLPNPKKGKDYDKLLPSTKLVAYPGDGATHAMQFLLKELSHPCTV